MKCQNKQEWENQPENVTTPSQIDSHLKQGAHLQLSFLKKPENRKRWEINYEYSWIQTQHLCEETLKSLGQFILGKKDKEVLTKAFKIMHDIKKVTWMFLDVSPQTTKRKELAIKFRGQKIKKGRIIFQWTIKFMAHWWLLSTLSLKNPPKTLNKPTVKTPGCTH